MCTSFCFSPSCRRVTGMPVHDGDDPGDVLLGDLLLEHRAVLLQLGELVLGGLERLVRLRQIAVGDLRGAGEVADALGALGLALERLDFLLGGADLVDDRLFVAPLGHQAGRLARAGSPVPP